MRMDYKIPKVKRTEPRVVVLTKGTEEKEGKETTLWRLVSYNVVSDCKLIWTLRSASSPGSQAQISWPLHGFRTSASDRLTQVGVEMKEDRGRWQLLGVHTGLCSQLPLSDSLHLRPSSYQEVLFWLCPSPASDYLPPQMLGPNFSTNHSYF